MLIVDRYLIWLFVKVLLICLFSLTGLFVVIDLFANLDEFLDIATRQGGLPAVMWAYYGPRVLAFFDRTSPLMALMAATFAVTSLQRSNELAALMAAGIPKIRVVRPLIMCTAAVSLLAAASRECLIPAHRDRLMRNAQDWEGTHEREVQPRYDKQTDVLISGRFTLAAERRINQPQFRLPRSVGRFGSQLLAKDAYYEPPTDERPGGYRLVGVQQPANVAEIPSAYLQDEPFVLSPKDTPWLQRDQCFVVSNVSFEQLAAGSAWRQFSGTIELIAALHNPSLDCGADARVTVHARFLQPLLDMTLFFLGLPLVIARENRNVFVAIGLCMGVVALFFGVTLACHALGTNYLLSPVTAAWCPVLIFVPVARLMAQSLWR
jgi:lipopolysaccharide export system permease protein